MINRRFFNFKTYDSFLAMKDQIPEDAIVFIQDKTCIWAHGKEYFCSGSQNADVTPVVNVPNTATVANNKLTFSNGTDTIVFTVSQRDGTITLTDSKGNTSSATYILKNEFDSTMDTFYTTLESVQGTIEDVQDTLDDVQDTLENVQDTVERVQGTLERTQDTLQNQIDDKADKSTVNQLNQWKDTVIERLMNINTQPEITIDSALSTTSPNPVENSVITHELSKKADADDLQNYALASTVRNKLDADALSNYVTDTELEQQLHTKQDILRAGDGIRIDNNTISSTIDTNMWVIVDELPTENINENKIYLIKDEVDGDTVYVEWRYKNGQWVSVGQRTPEVDLSGYQPAGDYVTNSEAANMYLSKRDAASTYQPIGDYAITDDVDRVYQKKGDFVEYDDLQAFRIGLDNIFQKKGAYALATDVTEAFNLLQSIIDLKYVLKKDVYSPEGGEFSTSDPTPITVGSSDGSGSGSTQPGTTNASNMITLTTAQYEALVRTNMVDKNTYYFTYEETTWGFGDKFPVTLTGGDTSDSIGTFPINLV